MKKNEKKKKKNEEKHTQILKKFVRAHPKPIPTIYYLHAQVLMLLLLVLVLLMCKFSRHVVPV